MKRTILTFCVSLLIAAVSSVPVQAICGPSCWPAKWKAPWIAHYQLSDDPTPDDDDEEPLVFPPPPIDDFSEGQTGGQGWFVELDAEGNKIWVKRHDVFQPYEEPSAPPAEESAPAYDPGPVDQNCIDYGPDYC